MKKALFVVALGLLLNFPAAHAIPFNFSYRIDAGLLTGQLEGTLQSDHNTVEVSSILEAAFNGVPGPALPFIMAYSEFLGDPPTAPVVSLDGALMDILAYAPASGDGFIFDSLGVGGAGIIFNSTPSFGGAFERYIPANWSITAAPLPSTALLMAAGGLALAWKRRKVST